VGIGVAVKEMLALMKGYGKWLHGYNVTKLQVERREL
jgi:hypothetical protein